MALFNEEMSRSYDERNSKLTSISENMHFLIRLVLRDLGVRARVLCVGVGTGAEILSLSLAYPEWTFVGVDPSEAMLKVCAERLAAAGVANRCELKVGYVEDISKDEKFDAVVSVLVGHFVKREERQAFYRNMQERLRSGGIFIDSEISFDLNSPEFASMVDNWKKVQELMGGTPEKLASLGEQMKQTDLLTILPPTEIENIFRKAGFEMPVRFFQAFMICGWYALKG